MTTDDQAAPFVPPTSGPAADVWRDLKQANDAMLHESTVTFTGGPADGQKFRMPDGVFSADIESAFGPIAYVRSEAEPYVFVQAVG